MITVEIDQHDLAELKRDLDALRPQRLLRDDLRILSKRTIQQLKVYPPALPTSRRTGRLRRGWRASIRGLHGDTVEVENLARYAGYVQGDIQTDVHRWTGWKTARDVLSREIERMRKNISREVDRIWRS